MKLPTPAVPMCVHINLCSGLHSQSEWEQVLHINGKKGQAEHWASHFPCAKISHYSSPVLGQTEEVPGFQAAPSRGSALVVTLSLPHLGQVAGGSHKMRPPKDKQRQFRLEKFSAHLKIH